MGVTKRHGCFEDQSKWSHTRGPGNLSFSWTNTCFQNNNVTASRALATDMRHCDTEVCSQNIGLPIARTVLRTMNRYKLKQSSKRCFFWGGGAAEFQDSRWAVSHKMKKIRDQPVSLQLIPENVEGLLSSGASSECVVTPLGLCMEDKLGIKYSSLNTSCQLLLCGCKYFSPIVKLQYYTYIPPFHFSKNESI